MKQGAGSQPFELPEELVRGYREGLRVRVAGLRDLRAGVQGGDVTAVAEVGRVAHALRGSGGSYGFPQISAAAGLLEDAVAPSERIQALDRLIACLEGVLEGPHDQAGRPRS